MSAIGVFFALTALEVETLRALPDHAARKYHVVDTLETPPALPRRVQMDDAWDAIHRCLGDGTLDEDPTDHPLRYAVLGGEKLNFKDDFIIRLTPPTMVAQIDDGLRGITQEGFRTCYFAMDYGFVPHEDDFRYTWGYFEVMRRFYHTAAQSQSFVLFSATQ